MKKEKLVWELLRLLNFARSLAQTFVKTNVFARVFVNGVWKIMAATNFTSRST